MAPCRGEQLHWGLKVNASLAIDLRGIRTDGPEGLSTTTDGNPAMEVDIDDLWLTIFKFGFMMNICSAMCNVFAEAYDF